MLCVLLIGEEAEEGRLWRSEDLEVVGTLSEPVRVKGEEVPVEGLEEEEVLREGLGDKSEPEWAE